MATKSQIDQVHEELMKRFSFALRRGKEIMDEFDAWHKSDFATWDVKEKADRFGWFVEVTGVGPKPDLDGWGIAYGEIAHHFRSLLNTALTRIAVVENISVSRRLQFPVALERKSWAGKGKRNGERDRLQGFPDRIVRAIYAIQPFVQASRTKTDTMNDVLAVLAWTNNQDKHHIELTGQLVPESFEHDFDVIFTDPTVNLEGAADVQYTYDFSLDIGSHLIDADTTPFEVQEVARGEFDLRLAMGVLDEAGYLTPLRDVMWEFGEKTHHIINMLLTVWADENFDVEVMAGSSDFRQGAAFGRAAVDQMAGRPVWDLDFNRSARGEAARLRMELESTFGIPDLGRPPEPSSPPVTSTSTTTGRVSSVTL